MADPGGFRVGNFIKMVQNNRVLYDHDHPEYNNDDLKEAIWNAISVQFDVNAHQCRALWMNLCTRYFTALKVINETEYVSRERIMNRCHLKFLDEHLKNFVHGPVDEGFMKQIVLEMKREIEKDRIANNYGFSSNIVASIRQAKLNKWCDPLVRKTHPDRIAHIRRIINGIAKGILKSMKPEFKRHKALKRMFKNKLNSMNSNNN